MLIPTPKIGIGFVGIR